MLVSPADPDLEALGRLEAAAQAASKWPPGRAAALARGTLSAVDDEVRQLAVDLRHLILRAEAGILKPADRDRLLTSFAAIAAALPEAGVFFDGFAGQIRRLRQRSAVMRRSAERRAERAARALQRVELDAHPDDVGKLRAFSLELLSKRGIPLPTAKRRGRPRRDDDELEPTEAEILAATKPMNAP
jgi:hypothetical protein